MGDYFTFFQENKKIETLCKSLQEWCLCTDEGEADGHLGVEIINDGEKITLKQFQLTKIIISILGLEDSNAKATLVVNPMLKRLGTLKIEDQTVSIARKLSEWWII